MSRQYEERRNARIRELRERREGPMRRKRRVQPLLLLMWILGTIALLGVLIILGFNTIFAPRVMEWVEANPGAIEHGIVQDFVSGIARSSRRRAGLRRASAGDRDDPARARPRRRSGSNCSQTG